MSQESKISRRDGQTLGERRAETAMGPVKVQMADRETPCTESGISVISRLISRDTIHKPYPTSA